MVRIEFGKGDFVWIGLVVILLGVGFGYAYNSDSSVGNPAAMGHSAGEIDTGCAAGEFLDGDGSCKSAGDIVADGGGAGAGTATKVYKCPKGTSSGFCPGGGAWASYGCQGQISSKTTCRNRVYPSCTEDRKCTYIGKMMTYP